MSAREPKIFRELDPNQGIAIDFNKLHHQTQTNLMLIADN